MGALNTKNAKDGEELFEELANRPGTKDVMELFERYNKTAENLKPYQGLFRPQYVTATSNSSNPVFE